jgi:16S rRNA (adenine1518-N6/adenine1519-N6)-dimethyltransferase
MIYQDSSELKELLKANGLHAKKSLGQNFLVNPAVLAKIISAADLTRDDYVIEVGPGLGILTQQLEQNAGRVLAVELDNRLIPLLQQKFAQSETVKILHQDALKLTLPEHSYKVIANIPYYITSPLLNHFLQPTHVAEHSGSMRPSLLVLLVQKEVAEKICVGTGDHTVLSLQVQIFGKPEVVATVDKSSFFPQPKVDSAILKIEIHPEPLVKDIVPFFKIIKKAFSQRRKTLLNSLNNYNGKTKTELEAIFKTAGINPGRRPQELEISEWEKLIGALK